VVSEMKTAQKAAHPDSGMKKLTSKIKLAKNLFFEKNNMA
jgi:hypothetical protein